MAECNSLHDIINPPKRAKNIDRHYYPILHVCINTRKGRERFKNFQILLDSGCSYTITMIMIVGKLHPEKDSVMQWHTQDGNITTNLKVKVDFTLPALSAMNVVTWNFHVYDSAKGRYDMILGRYILTELGLVLNFSDHVIEADGGTFKESTTFMVDLGTYTFKDLNIGKIKPE